MSLDQQIKIFEEKISQLEQLKHSWQLQSSGHSPSGEIASGDYQELEQVEKSLDDSYKQVALLKIRRMMGY